MRGIVIRYEMFVHDPEARGVSAGDNFVLCQLVPLHLFDSLRGIFGLILRNAHHGVDDKAPLRCGSVVILPDSKPADMTAVESIHHVEIVLYASV